MEKADADEKAEEREARARHVGMISYSPRLRVTNLRSSEPKSAAIALRTSAPS